MRLDRFIPARLRKLGPEALKFAAVGGLNTIINFVVLNVLIITVFTNGQLKANVVATAVATLASYLMNRHWTYRDRPNNAITREFTLFLVFNAAGLAIELAIMGMTKYWFGLTGLLAINAAKVIGLGLGTVFRFFTYRTFVFAPAPNAAAAMAGGGDINLGPAHLHVDSLDELLDAEAAASALSGVPVPAQMHPADDEFDQLTKSLDAEFQAELAALDAELHAQSGKQQRPE